MIAIVLVGSAIIFHLVYFDFNMISNIYFIITMILIAILINCYFYNDDSNISSKKGFKYRRKVMLKLSPIKSKGKGKYYTSSKYEYTFLAKFDDGESDISLPTERVEIVKKERYEDPRLEIYLGKKIVFNNFLFSVIPYIDRDFRAIAYVDKI